MKKLIVFFVFGCLSIVAFPQKIYTINGNKPNWQNIAIIPANTPFKIFGDGMVNFGCVLDGCIDDICSGVEGNSWWAWWQEKGILGVITPAILYNNYGTWFKFLGEVYSSNGSKCNYNQGGLWVVIANSSSANGDLSSNAISVDLYYWYNKLFNETGPIKYDQKVYVWVIPHDGGKDPFNVYLDDYADNIGSYRVWVTTYASDLNKKSSFITPNQNKNTNSNTQKHREMQLITK